MSVPGGSSSASRVTSFWFFGRFGDVDVTGVVTVVEDAVVECLVVPAVVAFFVVTFVDLGPVAFGVETACGLVGFGAFIAAGVIGFVG